MTSPESVNGLILLGTLVVFAVGWAAFAMFMYYIWGRKAPQIFPDSADDKKCIVDVEAGENRGHEIKKTDLTEIKVNMKATSQVNILFG